MLGRGLFRSISQIGASVLATVIATALYSGFRPQIDALFAAPPAPAVTAGGKFATRIDGVPAGPEAQAAALWPRSSLSLFTWGAMPLPSVALIDAVGWDPVQPPAAPPVKISRVVRETRRVQAVAETSPLRRAPAIPQLDLRTAPAVVEARNDDLWSTTKSAVQSVASFGGSLVERILPYPRWH